MYMDETSPNYTRIATSMSAAVDEAILKYERGDYESALIDLRNHGFRASDIHRLINHPEKRRKYINDVIAGF